jgi:DNA-binding beta-propeller fold protein YncE
MNTRRRVPRWPVGLILVPVLCLTALDVGSETIPVTQLSLQLRSGEADATPPAEPPAEDNFARFDRFIGDFGIMSGSFDTPVDIAIDGNENLFVLDQGNYRVQTFDASSQYVRNFGEQGTRTGQFKDPGAISVDRLGFVYVVDSGNHRIQKFKNEGDFVLEWGSLGTSPGLFNKPQDITFDADNNDYVAEP